VVPKPVLVSEGDDANSITSRYFTPLRCHSSHAVTGAIGVATAFALPGTVASGIARAPGAHTLAVLHPEGRIEVEVAVGETADGSRVERAALVRTARRIMQGHLTLPAYVFSRKRADKPAAVKPAPSAVRDSPDVDIIVPTSPGGANDAVARIVASALATLRGCAVSVDNRAGANGTVACNYVRSARPDGRTLLLGYTATHGIHPAWEDVGYDPIRDFAPVGIICSSPTVLVVPTASPLRSLAEAMQASRRASPPLRYAASGRGTLTQLAAELFASAAEAPLEARLFNGSAPALAAMMQGQADLMFTSLYAALPHLRSGKLRALAIAQASDETLLIGCTSMTSADLPELDLVQWYGLLAPARTPLDVVEALNRDLACVLGQSEVAARLHAEGATVATGTPESMRDLLVNEAARWRATLDVLNTPKLTDTLE
jgi:tripartite-type tricarboxylate transporter receptor subunit TctC